MRRRQRLGERESGLKALKVALSNGQIDGLIKVKEGMPALTDLKCHY